MTWLKNNPVPVAVAATAFLAMAALAYLAMGASQSVAEASSSFDNELRQLDALKKQKPYPSQTTLQALQTNVTAYEKALTELKATLADLDEPSSSTTPQAFQDALRQAVDGISSAAITKKVALPEAFYLGFDEFRSRLPSKEEAVTLDREFNVIKGLVTKLVGLPVESIDSLTRLPQSPVAGEAPSPVSKKRFTISFTAAQKELIQAFNLVSRSDRFLIIRSATFENSNPTPPSKGSAQKTPGAAAPPPAPRRAMARGARSTDLPFATTTQPAMQDSHIDVVFGNESVTATLLVEIPTFPEPSNESAPANPKP